MDVSSIQKEIEHAVVELERGNKDILASVEPSVHETMKLLDTGKIRVAEVSESDEWLTHAWIKQAILLYFRISKWKR